MNGFEHLFILLLDEQRYALQLSQVSRVVRMVEITPLPSAAPGVLGVVNVQGEVLSVLDLRYCLQQRKRQLEPQDLLVIAEAAGGRVALVASAVDGVRLFPRHPPVSRGDLLRRSEYLERVLKLPEGLVLLCDLEKLVSICQVALPQWGAPAKRASSAQALPAAVEEHPDPARRLLRERAQRLAAEPAQQEGVARLEIVEFLLSDERYAFESHYIREVYPLRELTPLPGTPAFVLGIINMRGKILSVLDMRSFFDLAERGLSDLNKVIVLAHGGMEFGVLADAILGVRTISGGELQPPLATGTGIRAEYLKGVTAQRLVVLDAARLLHDRSIIVHEEA
jgi:purine-binding chemotaxis protein CheW